MARKTKTRPLPTAMDAVTAARHTDWEIAHASGQTRNGRRVAFTTGAHGGKRTKAAQAKTACRGRVAY